MFTIETPTFAASAQPEGRFLLSTARWIGTYYGMSELQHRPLFLTGAEVSGTAHFSAPIVRRRAELSGKGEWASYDAVFIQSGHPVFVQVKSTSPQYTTADSTAWTLKFRDVLSLWFETGIRQVGREELFSPTSPDFAVTRDLLRTLVRSDEPLRTELFNRLARTQDAHGILSCALSDYHKWGGDDRLSWAASLIEEIGAPAFDALKWLFAVAPTVSPYFVTVCATLRGASTQQRGLLLAQIARHGSSEALERLEEALEFTDSALTDLVRSASRRRRAAA